MEKATIKILCDAFLNLKSVLIVIVFSAVICAYNSVADKSGTKANGWITSLSATTAQTDTFVESGPPIRDTFISEKPAASNEYQAKTEPDGEWQTVRMRVTAYCPCPKCCGKYSDGITACGYKICQGDVFIAADMKYPFGTEMIIPGYNNAEPVKVLDRGGVIRGNRLDVFFNSHREARKWGVKYIEVKVLRSQQD